MILWLPAFRPIAMRYLLRPLTLVAIVCLLAAGGCKKSLETQLVGKWKGNKVDVVIADPSRAGLGKDGARAVLACDPERVVLVSCDAAALARDVGLLVGADYRLTSVTPVDLFAHTPHIECVTVLDR